MIIKFISASSSFLSSSIQHVRRNKLTNKASRRLILAIIIIVYYLFEEELPPLLFSSRKNGRKASEYSPQCSSTLYRVVLIIASTDQHLGWARDSLDNTSWIYLEH